MRKQFRLIALFFAFVIVLAWQGCNQDEDDPSGSWTDEDQQSYETLINLQEEGGLNLATYLMTQDTADALASLAQWFLTDPSVEWAEPGSQGVMVQYKNGLRGGILLDGEDTTFTTDKRTPYTDEINQNEKNISSIPNKKEGAFINPHYIEREMQSLLISNVYNAHAHKVLDNLTTYTDIACKLDVFADLDKYGYIHIYSHGIAWPKKKALVEVYLMTGERPTAQVSEKYGELLKSGDIITVYFNEIDRTVYCISPEFIKHYNDFSKDTVLFYGGFCYSFQGHWPDLYGRFADGAYFGHTWSVRTGRNAEWAKSLFRKMADVAAPTPWTTEKWLTGTPELPKEYFNAVDQKWVRVQYTGNAELALWEKAEVKLNIQSTEADGAPITVNGEIATSYTFKCNVEGEEIQFLKFTWDFGDGSSPQEVFQSNEVNHSWSNAGTFTLKAEARDIDTDALLAETSGNVKIGQEMNQYVTTGPASNGNYSGNFKYTITTTSGYNFEVTADESDINGSMIRKMMQIDFQAPPAGSSVIFNITCEATDLSSVFPGVVQIINAELVKYWNDSGLQSNMLGAYNESYQFEYSTSTSGYCSLTLWMNTAE